MTSDADTKASLDGIINRLCKTRKRHDGIIMRCVQDTVRMPLTKNPIHDFATYLCRRLLKNEAVVVNMMTLAAIFARDKHAVIPDDGLVLLQHYLKRQPLQSVLESQPILNVTTHKPILLIIARHAFRVMEIAGDIFNAINPDAPEDLKARNSYLANIANVTENLMVMGSNYGASDIIDCLNMIKEHGAFYLRAGYLYTANIEPKPFIDKIEKQGFQVSILLDEDVADTEFVETDFLKRLQGLLIARSESGMERAMQHIDFLQDLTRHLPLPKPDLAKPLQLG